MEHSYFKDKISAYHDGELKHEEEHLIAEHIKTCEECQQLLSELEAFDRMVEKHSGLKDDDYWERSAQKIEQALGSQQVKTEVVDVKKSSWYGLGWKLASVAATVAIIAFIALYETDITDSVNKEIKPRARSQSIEMDVHADSLAEVGDAEAIHTQPELEAGLSADTVVATREELAQMRPEQPYDEIGAVAEEAPPVVSKEKSVTKVEAKEDIKIPEVSDESPAEPFPYTQSHTDLATKEAGRIATSHDILKKESVTKTSPAPVAIMDSDVASGYVSKTDASRKVVDAAELAEIDTSQLTLEQWRTKRDSLETVVSSTDIGILMENEMLLTAKAKDLDKKARAALVDSLSSQFAQRDPQLLLLESYYQVGLLTDNKKEYERSIDALQEYLDKDDSVYKLNAAWYIQQLEQRKW